MKIVILDGYTENPGDLSWAGFEALGDVTVYDRTPPEEILARMGDAPIVYTNKTPLTAETLRAAKGLRYVGVLATGYNVVDVAEATRLHICVTNIPTYGTAAVAQCTFALLLELCLQVGRHSEAVHRGAWCAQTDFTFRYDPLMELAGKTMGLIGFGRIGQAVACIAVAMGMRVLAYDPRPNPALETAAIRLVSLDTLLAQADVVSLHCPLTAENTGLINRARLAQMKDGAMLLNTARGPLLVEKAVREALESGHLAGAAMDVLCVEPMAPDCALLGAPHCILTPHIAWAAKEARARLMDMAVENLRAFLAGTPVNVVG
ncbi:MAG: D-2-hydroxyacid dehydrogenase [Clostridia bacterium]